MSNGCSPLRPFIHQRGGMRFFSSPEQNYRMYSERTLTAWVPALAPLTRPGSCALAPARVLAARVARAQ